MRVYARAVVRSLPINTPNNPSNSQAILACPTKVSHAGPSNSNIPLTQRGGNTACIARPNERRAPPKGSGV